jgi:DNA polymerase-3 subunit alpha
MSAFVHLRLHSTYSLSEGASTVQALVGRAKSIGMPAMALTDRDNLFGAAVFSKEAASKGVQPIIGCQFVMEYAPDKRGNILLLAQDAIGYANICALLRANSDPRPDTDGVLVNPTTFVLDPDTLRERSAGLILLTGGGQDGLLPQLAARSDTLAAETFQWLLSVFGDRLYVEICRNAAPNQAEADIEENLIALANGVAGPVQCDDGLIRSEAPLVATSDIWYATVDRHDAWLLLGAVVNRSSVTMDGERIVGGPSTRHFMRTSDDMKALFADLPEAFDNTANIARRCAFMVKGRAPILPAFPTLAGHTEAEELREQSLSGLHARLEKAGILGDDQAPYWSRIDYELSVIEKMEFPGYFLIVSDFIKWAKARDIPVGPGRGSGAGSVVAWALTITDLNPLDFNLLFERFLNPDRISMPDFDIDFCQDRREEVRDYVRDKYGADRVAMIATFGYIKSKTALSDIQRILVHDQLGVVSFGEVKELTASIPKKEDAADPMELEEAYEKDGGFRAKIENSDKLRMLFEQAKKIEGLVRSSGIHAAGVVIADRPLEELVPITYDAKSGMPVAGFNMKGVEDAGLVKFDFLGLTTLSVMKLATDYIKQFRGTDIDLSLIPRDDRAVYARLSEGHCTGVFQFEGGGMRDVMRQIRPTCFEDLIAIVALYRPGPMAYIPAFAARKAGTEPFTYPGGADKTEKYLAETYGIMVYQEQVMQVAQSVAGYSLGGADLLRRAMGKKDAVEMARQEAVFIEGAMAGYVEFEMEDGSVYRVHRKLKIQVEETDERLTVEEIMRRNLTPVLAGLEERVPDEPSFRARNENMKIKNILVLDDGLSSAAAKRTFDDIDKFANYGFNKSHAAAYAWIGYQTAWLKTHYPAEYLSALMTYYPDKPERLTLIKDELDAMGVPMLPPDVNLSYPKFRPEALPSANGGFAVRFGLSAVKQVARNAEVIAEDRAKGGAFRSLEDFHRRVGKKFNKDHYERLSEVGAFDSMSASRHQASSVLAWLAAAKDKAPSNQTDMFGGLSAVQVPKSVSEVAEWPDILQREFKSIGFYAGRHPIDSYVPRLKVAGVRRRNSIFTYMAATNTEALTGRRLCAMVDEVTMRNSSAGTTFVLARVSERGDSYTIACFENRRTGFTADDIMRILGGAKASRRPVVFEANLKMEENGSNVKVNSRGMWDVDEFLSSIRGRLVIKLDGSSVSIPRQETAAIRDLVEKHGEDSAEVADAQARCRLVATGLLVDDIRQKLQRHALSEDPSASAILIETDGESFRLPGLYKISMTLENALRGSPGVVSLKESVGDLPDENTPALTVQTRREAEPGHTAGRFG